jgi:hypothetical protein
MSHGRGRPSRQSADANAAIRVLNLIDNPLVRNDDIHIFVVGFHGNLLKDLLFEARATLRVVIGNLGIRRS